MSYLSMSLLCFLLVMINLYWIMLINNRMLSFEHNALAV